MAALIADDDDLVTYVGRLEEMVDEMGADGDDDYDDDEHDDDDELEPLVESDPDVLAAEVEQFLRDHNRDT